MPIFEKNGKKALFIHIPKAAGTTIEDAFVDAGFEMSYRRGGKYGALNDLDKANGCSPQHLHANLLDKCLSDHSFDVSFTVVRHPLERMISEYKFRTESRNSFALGKSLDEFADTALSEFQNNPLFLDNHIRPQVQFLWNSCKVLKLENGLDELSELVSNLINEDVSFSGPPKMRSKKSAQMQFSVEVEAKLRQFYTDDFKMFGYE